MTLLIGALTIGLILSLLALGVFISFRIFNFPDITADGSFPLGAAIAATLLVLGVNPLLASLAGFGGGMLAGTLTGLLHTKCNIHGLLSGILVMTALYSVNLHVMGKSNVPLLNETTLATYAEQVGETVFQTTEPINLAGWEVSIQDASLLSCTFGLIVIMGLGIHAFFRTNIGIAMCATGDNQQMMRAQGVNVGIMITLGLALSNGMIALSGALLAQYQGFADVQMGIGMIVLGLASVIIGEALIGTKHVGLTIVGAVMGSILFRLLVAIALRWGLNPNDLKMITAIFVFLALVLPTVLKKLRARKGQIAHA